MPINFPEHIRTTKAKYTAEKSRIETALGSRFAQVDSWNTFPDNLKADGRRWANSLFFCTDTGEIFHRGVAYGGQPQTTNASSPEEIDRAVFPLEFVESPKSLFVFEKGASANVSFVWSVKRKGVVVEPTGATVNGNTAGVASNKKSFSEQSLRANKTYDLLVQYNTYSVAKIIEYQFKSNTYLGSTSNSVVNSNDLNQTQYKDFEKLEYKSTPINCSGGKNVFFAYPASLQITKTPEIWINGLKCTDVSMTTLYHTNSSGFQEQYTVIKTNNRYNAASVSIEIK